MTILRRADLHLAALDDLRGRPCVILFPDGWYGRPHDTSFAIETVDLSSDPVRIEIADRGLLLIGRDCRVFSIRSRFVSVRLNSGMTRRFAQEEHVYEGGFLSFILDKAITTPFVDLHAFMNEARE